MTYGVTRKQSVALTFITQRLKETGIAPSHDEIRDVLGLKSKSSVTRVLDQLEGRGWITRRHRKARAIALGDGAHEPRCKCETCDQRRYDIHLSFVKALFNPVPVEVMLTLRTDGSLNPPNRGKLLGVIL